MNLYLMSPRHRVSFESAKDSATFKGFFASFGPHLRTHWRRARHNQPEDAALFVLTHLVGALVESDAILVDLRPATYQGSGVSLKMVLEILRKLVAAGLLVRSRSGHRRGQRYRSTAIFRLQLSSSREYPNFYQNLPLFIHPMEFRQTLAALGEAERKGIVDQHRRVDGKQRGEDALNILYERSPEYLCGVAFDYADERWWLEKINSFAIAQEWTTLGETPVILNKAQLNVEPPRVATAHSLVYRRHFYNGLFHGGELICGLAALKDADRRKLWVNGEPTSELRFEDYFVGMFFHRENLPVPEDFYAYLADKAAFADPKARDLPSRRCEALLRAAVHAGTFTGIYCALLREHVGNNRDSHRVFESFSQFDRYFMHLACHPLIGRKVGSDITDLDSLTWRSGMLMSFMLLDLQSAAIPALALRDAIVVPTSRKVEAQKIIADQYKDWFNGFEPRITCIDGNTSAADVAEPAATRYATLCQAFLILAGPGGWVTQPAAEIADVAGLNTAQYAIGIKALLSSRVLACAVHENDGEPRIIYRLAVELPWQKSNKRAA